jgi:hypothetical protein
MKFRPLIAFIALLGLIAGSSLCAEPALLGHPSLRGQTLDNEAVKSVLLGKKVALGDTRVVIIIARNSDTQSQFLQRAVGMTTSQFQTHWRRLFMTGGGSAPKIVETEADACKLAASTPGAVLIAETGTAPELTVLAQ